MWRDIKGDVFQSRVSPFREVIAPLTVPFALLLSQPEPQNETMAKLHKFLKKWLSKSEYMNGEFVSLLSR